MDGTLAPAAAPAGEEDQQALLEFLYLCPHGLAEFDASGQVGLMNPACLQLLMPLARGPGGVGNLLDLLAPYAPDLGAQIAGDQRRRGLLLDGVRIHVGRRPARPSAPGRSEPAEEPLVLSLTVLRLRPDRLMAVLSDVSRQVAQERRLREAEAWITAVAQGCDDYAFFALDAAGAVIEWNASCERLFGLAAAEVLGANAARLLGVHSGDPRLLEPRLAAARREGFHLAEEPLPRGKGRFLGTSVISVMRGDDPAEEVEAYLVVVRDTTERRNSVEVLRRALCTDHLTGVLNRRHFFELATQALLRARVRGQPLSALMVDADHFKGINDRFGHAAGDVVLVELARLLQDGVRTGQDLVGRLGGEEFCVLLPGLGRADAARVAERLRGTVAAARIPLPGEVVAPLSITASFGVAELQAEMLDAEALLRAADQALYAAKGAGRDRVSVAVQGEAAG